MNPTTGDELEQADTISLPCEICGQVIVGAARGKGSASWKMGTHRYTKHGVTTKDKGRGAPSADELAGEGARPVLATVSSIAAAVGNRKGAPNADELTRGLGRGVGLTSLAVASWMVDNDPGFGEGPDADAARDRMVEQLSLSDKAARDIMGPIGRALAPTRVNTRYGRGLVENVDVIASVSELATLALHWRQYMRLRAAGTIGAVARSAPGFYSSPVPDGFAGPVVSGGDLPEFARELATPAPQTGFVVGPEQVAALRAQQQNGGQ